VQQMRIEYPVVMAGTPLQGNDAKCGFRVPHGSEGGRLRFYRAREALSLQHKVGH
jgi:hypothetical protein